MRAEQLSAENVKSAGSPDRRSLMRHVACVATALAVQLLAVPVDAADSRGALAKPRRPDLVGVGATATHQTLPVQRTQPGAAPVTPPAQPTLVQPTALAPSGPQQVNTRSASAQRNPALKPPGTPVLARTESEPPRDEGLVLDYVVASIKGEPLTLSDLRRYAEVHGERVGYEVKADDPEVKRVLRSMVLDELLRREAATMGLAVADEEVQAYVEEIKRQNGVDHSGLESILREKGMTFDEYRAQVRTDILRTRVLGARVRPKVRVLDEQVEAKAKSKTGSGGAGQRKAGSAPAGARLQQIVLRGGDVKDLHEQIEALKEKIEDGASWADAGGENYADLGSVRPEDLRDELRRAVEKLGPGEVSDVIELDDAVYLVGYSKEGEAPDEDASSDADLAQARRELTEEQFRKAVDEFLGVELPKKYDVQYKL